MQFDETDLQQNRQGKLTARQNAALDDHIRDIQQTTRGGLIALAGIFGAIALLLYGLDILRGESILPSATTLILIALLAGLLLLVYVNVRRQVVKMDELQANLDDAQVVSISGPVRLNPEDYDVHTVQVDNTVIFTDIDRKDTFDLMTPGQQYRIYFVTWTARLGPYHFLVAYEPIEPETD
jgi:hypothetical protein